MVQLRCLQAARAAMVVAWVCLAGPALAEVVFRSGFDPLQPAPEVRVLRDDRVATLELDYAADNPWGQWWTMQGIGSEAAGFLVSWWPREGAAAAAPVLFKRESEAHPGCLSTTAVAKTSAGEARWFVTANRRVQLQPLLNDAAYQVRVERINSLGEIISLARVVDFDGGDGTRVAALRTQMTWFDDFNLPAGAADETLWNNATVTATDARFNLFFINDQYHAHTLQGTRRDHTGDKSQTSQRFRKRLRLEQGAHRRIVFDMDSPLSPRSVWYLDLNPVATDLTGHADFFDEEGAPGLPAGMLRLRAQGQRFSVNLIDLHGASHPIAAADMEALGRQAVSNVRRSFEVRVGTGDIEVYVDGRRIIDADFAPYAVAPGDYELLWIGFGYNTPKDAVPHYLLHWDNFGFDGPLVDAREVHNYVTRIAGTDYRKANRNEQAFPSFSVHIPDDLRPVVAGATAEAWLVFTYQMGDYSPFTLVTGDHVRVNGGAQHALPARINNSVPTDPDLLAWGMPHTVRIKLGDLVQGGSSPLVVGDNSFQFFAQNTGLLGVHVEVFYPPGSAPNYTPPAAIHPFPLHADLPRLGLPARFERIGATPVESRHLIGEQPAEPIAVSGVVPLTMVVGNHSYADWAPELMLVPVASTEVWSTGGTAGIQAIEVFRRPLGASGGAGDVVLRLETARDVPAPQGRYTRAIDTRGWPNGDYELFVQAQSPSGLRSHPSYGNEVELWDPAQLSGAYYPIRVRVQN